MLYRSQRQTLSGWSGLTGGLILVLVVLCGCRSGNPRESRATGVPPLKTVPGAGLQPGSYHLRAGGPQSFVGLTNSPASNRVRISFSRKYWDGLAFRLTNGEPHAILLWNVRVQVRSVDGGTDGFGWDTVSDDYPNASRAAFPPGATGEFRVEPPPKPPWRVCILYSIDWTDGGKSYSGNYESISPEMIE